MSIPLYYYARVVMLVAGLATTAGLPAANAEPRVQPSVQLPRTDDKACPAAIQSAEQSFHLPAQLLGAIGLIESGRVIPQTGRIAAWPWTINVGGTGYFYETKAQAIAAVQGYQAKGMQSIDVGCMQVNLSYHPDAFASLDQAFDPASNATYAAGFLTRLFAQSRNWATAAAAYHSQTPGVSDAYVRRVVASWPMAVRYVPPAALAAIAMGTGMATPSTRAEPGRDCLVSNNTAYTAEFQKSIVQAAADHARLLKEMGVSSPPRGRSDCGSRPTRLQSAQGRLAKAPTMVSG